MVGKVFLVPCRIEREEFVAGDPLFEACQVGPVYVLREVYQAAVGVREHAVDDDDRKLLDADKLGGTPAAFSPEDRAIRRDAAGLDLAEGQHRRP